MIARPEWIQPRMFAVGRIRTVRDPKLFPCPVRVQETGYRGVKILRLEMRPARKAVPS